MPTGPSAKSGQGPRSEPPTTTYVRTHTQNHHRQRITSGTIHHCIRGSTISITSGTNARCVIYTTLTNGITRTLPAPPSPSASAAAPQPTSNIIT